MIDPNYLWLIGDEADSWLTRVAVDLPGPVTPASVSSLRKSLGAERTTLVLEQVELRRRGREKCARAERMFFTRKGLEQATDEAIASYKASRFRDRESIADLCCGIGGDAMMLAEQASTTLVDLDEISLIFACENVRRIANQSVVTCACDVNDFSLAEVSAWHIDPDRRVGGKRTAQVDFGSPGIDAIDRLLVQCSQAAIKLAPAAEVPDHWMVGSQREWIESRGECRQQVVWHGELADSETRTATLLDENGEACSFSGTPTDDFEIAAKVGTFVFDPSPSLMAAGLCHALSNALELQSLNNKTGYLTSDEPIIHPHLQAFEIVDEVPLDRRMLKSYLRERGIGRLEIKKRGVDVLPEKLRSELDPRGDGEATLIVTHVAERIRVLVARRLIPEIE